MHTGRMFSQRSRPILYLVLFGVAIWAAAVMVYKTSKNAAMTAQKLDAYIESVDLSKLSAAERARALKALADKINALSYEERRKTRLERSASKWFEQMTEPEKAQFVESTMPAGFKQMLTAFEQLPEEKRRKAIDDSLRRLREEQQKMRALEGDGQGGANGPPPLSPELQARIKSIGLRTFYSESSAQTKAELAPVLEELQRGMENGRWIRR